MSESRDSFSPREPREALQYMMHTVVYDTCYSPCGKYLAAGNKYGDIALFSLTVALSSDVRPETKCPVFVFSAYKGESIYNLLSTDTLLICSGEGTIQAYRWSDLIHKSPRIIWSLAIPKKGVFSNPEINCCQIQEENGVSTLYAGSGDNLIHMWDIGDGTYKGSLDGHTDYIHSIALKDSGTGLVSTSEDGSAIIWDLRSNQKVHEVKPFQDEMCARPDMGKWLKALAIDEDNYWLLLGGGPTLSAWHMKTLTPAVTFDTPGVAQNVAMFYEDKIFSAGTSNVFNHWSITGNQLMSVPVSPTSVFSLRINTALATHKVMSVAGGSHKVDICTNFGYTAFSLSFTPPAL